MNEVKAISVPVSSSVMLILYSVMMPLVVAIGGALQISLMDVELGVVILAISGESYGSK